MLQGEEEGGELFKKKLAPTRGGGGKCVFLQLNITQNDIRPSVFNLYTFIPN